MLSPWPLLPAPLANSCYHLFITIVMTSDVAGGSRNQQTNCKGGVGMVVKFASARKYLLG